MDHCGKSSAPLTKPKLQLELGYLLSFSRYKQKAKKLSLLKVQRPNFFVSCLFLQNSTRWQNSDCSLRVYKGGGCATMCHPVAQNETQDKPRLIQFNSAKMCGNFCKNTKNRNVLNFDEIIYRWGAGRPKNILLAILIYSSKGVNIPYKNFALRGSSPSLARLLQCIVK